jgi:hypothetical protein
LKRDNPADSYHLRNRPQDGCRVAKKHEDVTSNHSVERTFGRKIRNIRLREVHMSKAKFSGASCRARHGARVAFGADDFTGGPDDTSCDQRNVPYSGTEIKNALSRADSR